jgi:dephospho-CoA kinase
MKFIGITGGVGAGKSEILSYLATKPRVRVMLADNIAHELMSPGNECYDRICEEFAGEDIFTDRLSVDEDKTFDRIKMASIIFKDEARRDKINSIVHPAVKKYVKEVLRTERERGELLLLVLEAALLIEENYDEICDELWYIWASQETRSERLKSSRGYSDEKIRQIFDSQLADEVYRSRCAVVIDNNGAKEEAFRQIDAAMERVADDCIMGD